MTKKEYKIACLESDITFHETSRTASPEQLEIKAQLLQRYRHTELQRAGSVAPEIIIYAGDKIVTVYFPNQGGAFIFWMNDVPDYILTKIDSILLRLDQTIGKVEEIIG